VRKFLILTFSLLSAPFVTTLCFWVHSWQMPECVVWKRDVRSIPPGPVGAYIGTEAVGFYFLKGRMGVLSHAEGTTGYYAPDIIDPANAPPVVPSQLVWDHSESPDGVQPADLALFHVWSRFGVSAHDGDECGMSHATHITAYMVDDWEVAATLGVLLVLVAWRLRQTRTRQGHCQKCDYDLRGHQNGAISARCPECGHAIGNHQPPGASPGHS
jgi:hypothetical protein